MNSIESDILQGQVFGSEKEKKETKQTVKASKERRHEAKTMAEATAGLKTLNSKKSKNKAGTFAKGTHGSGSAKMKAEYKNKRRNRSSQKK
jgi:hypothetical protein